jgi:hypothetical protein
MKKLKPKFFTKPVALVTLGGVDTVTEGFAVVEDPSLRWYEGILFIEERHGHDSGETVRGRRILIPMATVTSITEYDSTSEVYEHPRSKQKRKSRICRLAKTGSMATRRIEMRSRLTSRLGA